jgi:hypothetical protein
MLLDQAHERILHWLGDPSLIEHCGTREDINLFMLKEDQMCAGSVVPVTFAEFTVKNARPVDVFNTMLNTKDQKKWNPQAAAIFHLGDYPSLGARAYAVDFALPIVSDRELFQWQVADADFQSDEFWLVFSTENNEQLKAKQPLAAGATESSNCLGAYRITRSPEGAHVIITQHVNAHPPFPFPLHQIMNFLPAAWKGVVDFVTNLKQRSQYQLGLGWPDDRVAGPAFMLQNASTAAVALAPVVPSASTPPPSTTMKPPVWFKYKIIPKWVKNDYSAVRDRVTTWRHNHFPGQAKNYADDFTIPPTGAPAVGAASLGANQPVAMKAFAKVKPKAHVNNSMGWVVLALILVSLACCMLCCVYFCCTVAWKNRHNLSRVHEEKSPLFLDDDEDFEKDGIQNSQMSILSKS